LGFALISLLTLFPTLRNHAKFRTKNGNSVLVSICPNFAMARLSADVGRAIYVIQQTLPEFFSTGLITSINKSTGSPRQANGNFPLANVNPLDYHPPLDEDVDSIYSPNVRLSYTPPVALPAPFPKTLHIEGTRSTVQKQVH
jgi:hypothetical protein